MITNYSKDRSATSKATEGDVVPMRIGKHGMTEFVYHHET